MSLTAYLPNCYVKLTNSKIKSNDFLRIISTMVWDSYRFRRREVAKSLHRPKIVAYRTLHRVERIV